MIKKTSNYKKLWFENDGAKINQSSTNKYRLVQAVQITFHSLWRGLHCLWSQSERLTSSQMSLNLIKAGACSTSSMFFFFFFIFLASLTWTTAITLSCHMKVVTNPISQPRFSTFSHESVYIKWRQCLQRMVSLVTAEWQREQTVI